MCPAPSHRKARCSQPRRYLWYGHRWRRTPCLNHRQMNRNLLHCSLIQESGDVHMVSIEQDSYVFRDCMYVWEDSDSLRGQGTNLSEAFSLDGASSRISSSLNLAARDESLFLARQARLALKVPFFWEKGKKDRNASSGKFMNGEGTGIL